MPKQQDLANAIRALAMDAVQQANSGHPGMPMGMADIALALWQRRLRHNPANPQWANRDRFVLSNGHGSMLLYALLHLSGYALTIDDLKQFRQLHSKTPGHPEYGYTPGVETTTGPLGQGLANAVGLALAEKMMGAEFNRPGFELVDHHTYAFVGDGCLMEGISHEACSLAGTLGLGKLVVFYDDNGISIDGEVGGWFTDDTPRRFEAYGWRVLRDVDGHDHAALGAAIDAARVDQGRPTLICCKTVIGKGAPHKQGSHESHGAPLGAAEVAAARAALGWPHAPFEIPAEIYAAWDGRERGAALERDWEASFAGYRRAHPHLAAEFLRRRAGELPADFAPQLAAALAALDAKAETIATRKASQNAIGLMAAQLPELVGGSADLASSNLTLWPAARAVSAAGGGNYIYYGVREFGMAAIINGLALYGGLRPFGGTFLMFSEYARNALRMAALMRINPIFVFTHDSIGLGEDGPTHQPVEQTATLRMIPNMDVWRPADTAEALVAWQVALQHRGTPSCLVFCRQNLPYLPKSAQQLADIRRGAYVLAAEGGALAAVLIATGSEVELAMRARRALALEGVHVRLVSMPSPYNFDRQDAAYRDAVLPRRTPRVAVEAGLGDYWRKYVGLRGAVVGIDTFGESGPAAALYLHFGLTVEAVCAAVRALIEQPCE
ncbi:transketolase [Janthinobacterium sp. CG_S6]|uniref:transketolase n=1 Tax=Janthinobacterium sp. CG_S6 TaxID=3071707 RepID=UPI002DFE3F89|nr:transketolase [Janthinobacterium sp. CG_S6]